MSQFKTPVQISGKNVFEADRKAKDLETLSQLDTDSLKKLAKLSKNPSAIAFLADDGLINQFI